jgi:hypothetical protein
MKPEMIVLLVIALFLLTCCANFNPLVLDDGCVMQRIDNYYIGICGTMPTIQWKNSENQWIRAHKIDNKYRFFILTDEGWRQIGAKENIDISGGPEI